MRWRCARRRRATVFRRAQAPGWRGAGRRMRHSLRARLVLVFLLLAAAMAATFLYGMQKAVGMGWREAARPLLADYVDRLAAEVGTPPDVGRARALADRLPVTIRIEGPRVQWDSHPGQARRPPWRDRHAGTEALLVRTLADGHRLEFGVNPRFWHDRPRAVGLVTLAALLAFTLLAYKFVRRLLRPLDDIRAGTRRFGRGEFGEPIPVRRRDELGDLAADVNAMATSIHQMLEAKRALLLAISHELRSPLTRARLHAELLPEQGEAATRREGLLRDLQEMADLVTDLLESERLQQGHAALHREPTDLAALVQEAVQGQPVQVHADGSLPPVPVDRTRLRLLLRNVLDNALHHGGGAVEVHLERDAVGQVLLRVRDHGPGVDPAALAHLAEPFWRPDRARERATGGVGLGLYLCRVVAEAHGGRIEFRQAQPGLEVRVLLPAST